MKVPNFGGNMHLRGSHPDKLCPFSQLQNDWRCRLLASLCWWRLKLGGRLSKIDIVLMSL